MSAFTRGVQIHFPVDPKVEQRDAIGETGPRSRSQDGRCSRVPVFPACAHPTWLGLRDAVAVSSWFGACSRNRRDLLSFLIDWQIALRSASWVRHASYWSR